MKKDLLISARNVPKAVKQFYLIVKHLSEKSKRGKVTKTFAIVEVIDHYFNYKLNGQEKEEIQNL